MDEETGLRRSRTLALVAFLSLATSVWVPWWAVTWDDGQVATRDAVSLFRPELPLTTSWGPWVTGLLVAAALALLFVRVAAHSERHEPDRWRRDLNIAMGLAAAALVTASLWPASVPAFWGGRIYRVENVTTEITQTAIPVLGWWLCVLAMVLVLLAAWSARKPTNPDA